MVKKVVLIILTVTMVLIIGKKACIDSWLGKFEQMKKYQSKKYAKYMI